MGLALDQQAQTLTKSYLASVDESNAAVRERKDQAIVDEMKARASGLEESLRAKREQAVDSLATAVALGVTQARGRLETLYKAKNNDSLQGLDQLIASKKS
jgi:hypothetical protein